MKYSTRDNIPIFQQHILVAFGFILPLYDHGISFLATVMFLLFLLDRNLKSNLKYSLSNKAILALTAYFFVYIFWLFGTEDFTQAVHNIKQAKLYLLPIVIYPYLRYKIVTRFALAFILGMLVSEAYSYGIFFEILEPTKYGTPLNPTPLMSHIDYSMFLALTALIVLQKLTISRENKYIKLLLVVYFITVVTNLFITGGRTGQAIFLISIFAVLWLTFDKKIKSIIYSAILAITIVVLAVNFSPNFQKRVEAAVSDINKVVQKDNKHLYTSWGNRLGAYIISFHHLQRDPFFGVGTGDELIAQNKIMKEEGIKKSVYGHIHGQYNDAIVQFGLVGLSFFMLFLYYLYKHNQEDKDLKTMKIILVVFIFIFSFTERVIGGAFLPYLLIVFSALTMVKPENRYVKFFSQKQISFEREPLIVFGKYTLLTAFLAGAAKLNVYMNMEGYKEIRNFFM